MKLFSNTLLLMLLFHVQLAAQDNRPVSGLLLLTPARNHDSFDLFLPCKIDPLKTLLENLKGIKKDTAYQTMMYDFSVLRSAIKLRNGAFNESFSENLQYCLVVPVLAYFDKKIEKDFDNNYPTQIYRMPYTFNGIMITEFYRTKRAYLNPVKVIHLPGDKKR